MKSLHLTIMLYALISVALLAQCSLAHSPHCKAWLVQSIPTGMPHLARVPGVLSTADVFRWLAGNSTGKLDIIAQYWQLVAEPENPASGDYGYTAEEMDKFGSGEGLSVYKTIEGAADRNVSVRIMQHSGVYPDFDQESSQLASGRPNVQNITLLLSDWWGSGIIHAKVWISDHKDVYIGSANNDWKSLTQVKEVGVYLVDCPSIAKKVEIYFNNLWELASLNPSLYTKTVWDREWQTRRKVPCWSHFIHFHDRCRSPLPHFVEVPHVAGYPILSDPYMFRMPIETPGHINHTSQHHSSYLSFAPPEDIYSTMPRGRDIAWEHMTSVDGSTSRVRCNYCHHEMSGGATRMKEHLLGRRGEVVSCLRILRAIQDHIRSEVGDKSKVKASAKARTSTEAHDDDAKAHTSTQAHDEDRELEIVLQLSRQEAELQKRQAALEEEEMELAIQRSLQDPWRYGQGSSSRFSGGPIIRDPPSSSSRYQPYPYQTHSDLDSST